MQYLVQIVGDDDLPDGVTRVIVERDDEPAVLILNRDAARGLMFMRMWENEYECERHSTVLSLVG